jgi:glycosyltransferase involved in cell wall biosynthesis
MKRFLSEKIPLSLKLRLKRAALAPAAWALRLGARANLQAVNRSKFYGKLRDALEREYPPANQREAARAANQNRDTQVLVLDDRVPTPDRDAGSARMLFILRALSEWCHPVLVTTAKRLWPEYEKLLWDEGVETASALELRRLLKTRRFRVAIISRPEIAQALLKSVRRASPDTKIIYDMVDAHFIRLAREAGVTGDAQLAREAERYRKIETRLARASDLVWCNSAADREAMGRESPGVHSVVVPTIHRPHPRGPAFEEREHLLFVGNFMHRPNVDGVRFFVNEVLPAVRESLAGVELLLVGDNAPPEFGGREREGVHVLGYVPDIEPLFARARVFVAPVRFGAGIKGKVGEALAHAIPVVTTTVGAEGMFLRDGEEALVVNSAQDFAAAVVRLYRDAALWQRLSDNAHAHVERIFSPRVVGGIINDSIKKVLGQSNTGNV